jgi:alpha-L-fucosidase
LNVPPDRRGLIAAVDAERLRAFGRSVAETYRTDLAREARATSPDARGGAARFGASKAIDGDPATYWATNDGVTTGSIELTWKKDVPVGRVVLQEAIALGQRVEGWSVQVEGQDGWETIAQGTTIGHKRIARVKPLSTRRMRIAITRARACPTLSAIGVYAR